MIAATLLALVNGAEPIAQPPLRLNGLFYKEDSMRLAGRDDAYPNSNWIIRFMFPKSMESELVTQLGGGFKFFLTEAGQASPRRGLVTGAPIASMGEGRTDFVSKVALPAAKHAPEVAGATLFTWWDDRTEVGIVGDRGSSDASEMLASLYARNSARLSTLGRLASSHYQATKDSPVPMRPTKVQSNFNATLEGKSKRYIVEFKVRASIDLLTWESNMTFMNKTGGQVADLTTETRVNALRFVNDTEGLPVPLIKVEDITPAATPAR